MVDCGSSHNTNRFVCPNDRQLALRAKLKTGWSMKTSTLGYQSQLVHNEPLNPEEHAAIVEVIQRAEKIELNEQERVGRLVDRLENLRRNALGRHPSQCLLCGDPFGVLGAQKIVCMDCRRFACQKCVIATLSTKISPKEHWLCMICAESRDIWKKSGAWFFKCIPKYTLPFGEKLFVRNRSIRMSKSGREFKEDSSSDEDKKVWNKIQRQNSSAESIYDQDQIPHSSYNRQTSISESQISKELEPLRNYMGSMMFTDDKIEEIHDINNATCSEVSRRESMVSRSISEWNCSDNNTTKSDGKISPSTSSITSSIFKNSTDDQKSVDSCMGSIELSLTYDQIASTLHCTIYRAKNLVPMDISGLSDPFCKINILPDAKASTRLRTKTVHKTLNPEFNENLTFYDIGESDLATKSLHILVFDDDKYGHDYMGETKIQLTKLKTQNTIYLTMPLENLRAIQKGPLPAPEINQWFDDLWSRGQILISLCYSTKRRALLVVVIKCANLLPMDNNGFSDPFVKLQLRPDPYHRKHKTTIKWKNLNPVYNEEFAFETRPMELYTQSLHITVFDKDYGKSNDYLGGLILGGSGSKGQRLKHWLDMIRYPDHRHEAWHNLTEEVLD